MILVSACLLGINCKYNGENNYNQTVINFLKDKNYVPVCPEQLGGLTTPRLPCEIKNDKVINSRGNVVTDRFIRGAQETMKIAKLFNANKAILKSKSPSCGKRNIYDGSFSNRVIKGKGITASLLEKNNIEIYNEEDIQNLEAN